MTLGFFLALRQDVSHFLHAASLVTEAKRVMPGLSVTQLSDATTSQVPGVDGCLRVDQEGSTRPLLDQRLALYAGVPPGDWLFVDTDVSIRNDVRGVFDDPGFDVALCDRHWPHLPQGETMMHTMPFNTGVCFSRCPSFWADVVARWRAFPKAVQADWMSEQRAVYDVVRTGHYRVKIVPGMAYNYPPRSSDDAPVVAALVHYKGPRKAWLTDHAYTVFGRV